MADKQAEGMAETEREALAAKNREIGGEADNLSAAFTLSDGVSRALTLGTLGRSLNLRAAAYWKMPYHKDCV